MLEHLPWRELIATGGALVTLAQSSLPSTDVTSALGTMGVPGVVMLVLIWIIRDERADKAEMRKQFSDTIRQVSTDSATAQRAMADGISRLALSVESLDEKLETIKDLRHLEQKITGSR